MNTYLRVILDAINLVCFHVVRLVGGSSSREGRLEVHHNDVWGTVCDDGFTDAAATVVCYSLGYGYVSVSP